jgi:hypothetical protein
MVGRTVLEVPTRYTRRVLRRRWLVAISAALALHALVALLQRNDVRRAPAIANTLTTTPIELELHEDAPKVVAPASAPASAPPVKMVKQQAPIEASTPAEENDIVVDEAPKPSFAPRRVPDAIAGVPHVDDDTGSRIRDFVARTQADAGVNDFYAFKNDGGTLAYESKELKATIAEDGAITFEEKLPLELFTGKTLEFDLNGPLQRLAGNDPTAVQKSCIMESTRELRIARREQADRQRQTAALSELSFTLEKMWRDATKTNKDKRRAIFELWDECRDDAVGAEARELIVEFIRREMPKGTHLAYTSAELAHYNKVRTAQERFEPYGA